MSAQVIGHIIFWITLVPWAGLLFYSHIRAFTDVWRFPENGASAYQWLANTGVDWIVKVILSGALLWGLSWMIYTLGGCSDGFKGAAGCTHVWNFIGQTAFNFLFFLSLFGFWLGLIVLLATILECLTIWKRKRDR